MPPSPHPSTDRPSHLVYLKPTMLLLLVLGFSSGLPILLVFSTLGVWLTEVGVDRSTVALFSLASTPYTFKFLWAPLVDRMPVPLLHGALGHRRAWMLVSQVALALALIALAFAAPQGVQFEFLGFAASASENVVRTASLALVVATLSATQDIVLDAYRIQLVPREDQAAGAAVFVFGYRLGMLLAGAGALFLAAGFEASLPAGLDLSPWAATYACMGAAMAVGCVATLVAPRVPDPAPVEGAASGNPVVNVLNVAVIEPFAGFVRRHHMLAFPVLLFVFLFKLSDALAAVLRNPFLVEIGFDKTQIASIAQTYGMVATIVGALVGGALVRRMGLRQSLWVSLLLMIGSNLMFAAQANAGADPTLLLITITFENLTGGFGTAAFVAYLSLLVDRKFTATQYALLTSLASVGRVIVGSSMGVVATELGWTAFFVFTALAGAPAIAVLAWLQAIGRIGTELGESDQADDGASAATNG